MRRLAPDTDQYLGDCQTVSQRAVGTQSWPLSQRPLGIPCLGNSMCQGLEEGGLQTCGWWGVVTWSRASTWATARAKKLEMILKDLVSHAESLEFVSQRQGWGGSFRDLSRGVIQSGLHFQKIALGQSLFLESL